MPIVAFSLSFFLSFPLARLAENIGAVDFPDGERKRQIAPIVRLGGVAIYLSFAITLIIGKPDFNLASALMLLGGGAIMLFGIADDVFDYSAAGKLFAECFIAAASALFISSNKESGFSAPYAIFSLVFIIFMINAFNMTDGADGLCVSLTLVALFFLSLRVYFAYLLFFSVLGFLPRNLPAKMYLGECGAAFLGYAVAVFILLDGITLSSLSVTAIPAFEVVTTVIRRILKGKNPFSADRGHIHHKLQDAGLSMHSVALFLMAVAFAFSLGAFLC